ncbi:MAG: flavin reductase family protein [bacterium]|nr:flavin reductase family protein [bacterium]
MLDIEPKDLAVKEAHAYLLGGVAPRPIGLVSTVSPKGWVNLSPFSFFNAFGANPPTVAFSAARRGRDSSLKDTYNNIVATKECVIQAVTYDMVQQVSLASTEYETGIDEFVKSGFTPISSDLVKPPRVKESPFQMECRLTKMIPLGDGGGSGNLAVCEVVMFHISEDVLENGVIQPDRIDLVARMGADFYTRARGESIFRVAKPVDTKGVGYDRLPQFIRESDQLTANNLGQLGNVEAIPSEDDVKAFVDSLGNGEQLGHVIAFRTALTKAESDWNEARGQMFKAACEALECGDVAFAWRALLYTRMREV